MDSETYDRCNQLEAKINAIAESLTGLGNPTPRYIKGDMKQLLERITALEKAVERLLACNERDVAGPDRLPPGFPGFDCQERR